MPTNFTPSAPEFTHNVYSLKSAHKNRLFELDSDSINTLYQGIPTSDKLTGIELRLKNVMIKDNKTPRVFPFPGNASFYLIVVTIDNTTGQPKEFALNGFRGIGDNTFLEINRTIYYWNEDNKPSSKYPNQIHSHILIYKSKKGLRDTAKLIKNLKGSSEYGNIISNLGKLISNPASVAVSAISSIAVELGTLIGSALENIEDRPHYSRVASFTDIAGNFDQLGEHIYADEYPNDNASCDLALFIRDREREEKVLDYLKKQQSKEKHISAIDRAPMPSIAQIKNNLTLGKKSYT